MTATEETVLIRSFLVTLVRRSLSAIAPATLAVVLCSSLARADETIVASLSGVNYTYSALAGAYFVSADINGATVLDSDISGNEIFVGKDNETGFNTIEAGILPIILNVRSGAVITENSGQTYPDNQNYSGLHVFGGHTANISGGTISYLTSVDASVSNISGGQVENAIGGGSSRTNLTGGNVTVLQGFADSLFQIDSGSVVTDAVGNDNSVFSLNGGTVLGGFLLSGNSLLTIAGNELLATYSFFEDATGYDVFDITGTHSDAGNTPFGFQVRLYNGSDIANTQLRQVTFGVALVPESNTFTLMLPALAVLAVSVVRRRSACSPSQ
ncbi:MAG: hypothetical protein H7145_16250 [Akkermansiaceae bacterium]|nr:hypothetical protein [Armatimonadota bacterium]